MNRVQRIRRSMETLRAAIVAPPTRMLALGPLQAGFARTVCAQKVVQLENSVKYYARVAAVRRIEWMERSTAIRYARRCQAYMFRRRLLPQQRDPWLSAAVCEYRAFAHQREIETRSAEQHREYRTTVLAAHTPKPVLKPVPKRPQRFQESLRRLVQAAVWHMAGQNQASAEACRNMADALSWIYHDGPVQWDIPGLQS